MMDWMIQTFFSSMWGWMGMVGVIVLAAIAVGVFIPSLRLHMLAVVGAALSAGAIYAKGSADAKRRKQAEWDAAEKKSVERGNKAHADAKRDVAAGRVRDKFDRDDL